MMKVFLVLLALLFVTLNKSKIKAQDDFDVRTLNSSYDNSRHLFVATRRLSWRITEPANNIYMNNLHIGKTQKVIKKSTKFYCDTKNGPGRRSQIPPTSINKLHPGDIDIIAAMGDSLSSGNGALSKIPTQLINEYRSLSWSGGGHGTWRQFLTLPNILKEFNPNLYGYAIGNVLTIDKNSRFNLGEPVALSVDMPYQAQVLINRMKVDPNVNMEKHWKVLTILIGNLDFCMDSCYHSNLTEWADLHEKDLIKTLRRLRDNIPRLLVNIVSFPQMLELMKLNKGIICYFVHYGTCGCLFNSKIDKEKSLMAIHMWYEKDLKVAAMDEFNTENFSVIVQPFLTNLSVITNTGHIDWGIIASDCFHFSQKGHSLAAASLWNNMLQPIGKKQTSTSDKLICPTAEQPYIITRNNSPKLRNFR